MFIRDHDCTTNGMNGVRISSVKKVTSDVVFVVCILQIIVTLQVDT